MHSSSGLLIHPTLFALVNDTIAPGTGIDAEEFWQGFAGLVRRFSPRNEQLLHKRDALQATIDAYHREHAGRPLDPAAYALFLREIGYIVPEPPAVRVTSANVDDEIAQMAGPQLVCPIDNARFALNAANARWGSLLDAFYGTNAIPQTGANRPNPDGRYNPSRGAAVFEAVVC